MDVNHEQELELFQKHVSERFMQLLQYDQTETQRPEPLLSISWFRKLLDIYLCCESEFKAVLIINRDASHYTKPPLEWLLPEHLDRTIKDLDTCNAITHGIELVRHWSRLGFAVDALEQRPVVEGHVRRAKQALNSLLTSMMVNEKECAQLVGKLAERMWSTGRRGGGGVPYSYCES